MPVPQPQASATQVRDDSPLAPQQKGLTDQQAAARLARDGCNELASARPRSILVAAAGVMREPMFLLLIACGALYPALGNRQEALMLLGFVFVVIGITLFQENKVERALEALRNLASPGARVPRGGVVRTMTGREVVLGDIVLLAEGDRIPADAALLESRI